MECRNVLFAIDADLWWVDVTVARVELDRECRVTAVVIHATVHPLSPSLQTTHLLLQLTHYTRTDRHSDRKTERERERERDRQTDRHRDTSSQPQPSDHPPAASAHPLHTNTDRQTYREREADRQRERERERDRERETDRETDRQTNTYTVTHTYGSFPYVQRTVSDSILPVFYTQFRYQY